MRLLTCCLLLMAILLLMEGCASPGVEFAPPVEEPEPEPIADRDSVLVALGRQNGSSILETQWLKNCSTPPVLLLGGLNDREAAGMDLEPYLDALAKTLLGSGKVILVEPVGSLPRPLLPETKAAADSLARASGATHFGESLVDGPRGQRRLLLRIYTLPELMLIAGASTEYEF